MTRKQRVIRQGVYSYINEYKLLKPPEKRIKKELLKNWLQIRTENKETDKLDDTITKIFIRFINLYKL